MKPVTQELEILWRSVADVAEKGHCHMVAIVAMIAARIAAVRVSADMHDVIIHAPPQILGRICRVCVGAAPPA